MNVLRALAFGAGLITLLGAPALTVAPLTVALAAELAAPAGAIVLTVDGKIGASNTTEGKAAFDVAMLEALPAQTIETTTPWTEGPQRFTGVALKDLLAALDASGERVHATATNQYEVTFPVTDVTDHGGILAYRQNDAALPADKGPLWIVFPYDSDPRLLEDRFQSASIWNLMALSIN